MRGRSVRCSQMLLQPSQRVSAQNLPICEAENAPAAELRYSVLLVLALERSAAHVSSAPLAAIAFVSRMAALIRQVKAPLPLAEAILRHCLDAQLAEMRLQQGLCLGHPRSSAVGTQFTIHNLTFTPRPNCFRVSLGLSKCVHSRIGLERYFLCSPSSFPIERPRPIAIANNPNHFTAPRSLLVLSPALSPSAAASSSSALFTALAIARPIGSGTPLPTTSYFHCRVNGSRSVKLSGSPCSRHASCSEYFAMRR